MSDVNPCVCVAAKDRYFAANQVLKSGTDKTQKKAKDESYIKAAKQVMVESSAEYIKAAYVQ
jgi:hypothetical protein